MHYSDQVSDDIFIDSQKLDLELSNWEKVVLSSFLVLIVSILIVAIWSGILLHLGIEEGGGPLAMLMRSTGIHLLVS